LSAQSRQRRGERVVHGGPAARPSSSNIGASTTQVKAQASGSMRPQRWPISSRAAPKQRAVRGGGPAREEIASPGPAPVTAGSPARSVSDRFRATGPASDTAASALIVT